MKAPAFAYTKPATLMEVFDCLDDGDGVRLLAGGQSLIPALNMRLSAPTLLVDINDIPGLDGIAVVDETIRIGALVRHHELGCHPLITRHLPLLAKAVPHIAHRAIRNRGTIGGSLALADPSAELPACCVALDATIVLTSRTRERRIAAKDFFLGLYETALAPTEVLTAVEIRLPAEHAIAGFDELARRRGDYAIVGLAAQAERMTGGWRSLRLVFFGAGDRPKIAASAAKALVDGAAMPSAMAALEEDLSPTDDGECTAKTKLHLAGVLLGRVVAAMQDGRM